MLDSIYQQKIKELDSMLDEAEDIQGAETMVKEKMKEKYQGDLADEFILHLENVVMEKGYKKGLVDGLRLANLLREL